jgi:hypothetical protein
MKLGDLRQIFKAAEHIYRSAGDDTAAEALKEVAGLSDDRETMAVTAFAKLVGNRSPTDVDSLFRNGGGKPTAVSELRSILTNVQRLCASAGAKTAVKDLQTFSDLLKPYSDAAVDKACADIKHSLNQAAAKPARRSKAPATKTAGREDNAIDRHLTELRKAGADQNAFDVAFKKLKASKSLKLPDLAEIAHQFSLSVAAYESKAAAYTDIEKAFVRQARFENKLR